MVASLVYFFVMTNSIYCFNEATQPAFYQQRKGSNDKYMISHTIGSCTHHFLTAVAAFYVLFGLPQKGVLQPLLNPTPTDLDYLPLFSHVNVFSMAYSSHDLF